MDYNFKYSKILPPLSEIEYETLKSDIAERGILVPVVIDEDSNVIDGQHRIQIANELGLTSIPMEIRIDLSEEEKQQIAIDLNLHRRHLSKEQRKEWAEKLEGKGYKQWQIASMLGVDPRTVRRDLHDNEVRTNVLINKTCKPKRKPIYINSSADFERIRKIIEKAQEKPEYLFLFEELLETANIKRGNKEVNRLGKLEKRQEVIFDVPGNDNVWHGDFREVGQRIPDNSVDLIFTDPPYNEDAIQLYRDLGMFAQRVLKPGGLCLAYSGQIFLPEVINALGESLEYVWTFSTRHSAAQTRIFKVNVKNTWKPILCYCKPPLDVWWQSLPDSIFGTMEKTSHKWQQDTGEAKYYLEYLCPENGLIVDPFAGSGTTLLAARELLLRYIGIEDDMEDVQKIIGRLNDDTTTNR